MVGYRFSRQVIQRRSQAIGSGGYALEALGMLRRLVFFFRFLFCVTFKLRGEGPLSRRVNALLEISYCALLVSA
jgi:hypothetical protein